MEEVTDLDIAEAEFLGLAEESLILGEVFERTCSRDFVFEAGEFFEVTEEVAVNLGDFVKFFDVPTAAECFVDHEDAFCTRACDFLGRRHIP